MFEGEMFVKTQPATLLIFSELLLNLKCRDLSHRYVKKVCFHILSLCLCIVGFSAGLSLLSLGWAIAAYTKAMRQAHQEDYKL